MYIEGIEGAVDLSQDRCQVRLRGGGAGHGHECGVLFLQAGGVVYNSPGMIEPSSHKKRRTRVFSVSLLSY